MKATGETMDRDARTLYAYHDGELGRWARRRFERRLARSPELRRELEALARMGELARGADATRPAPDLWAGLAGRMAAADAEREVAGAGGRPGPAWLRPALAAGAAAALFVAVTLGLRDTGAPPPAAPLAARPPVESPGVVRWIDPGTRSVLVLEDDEAGATIIWVLEGDEVPRGEGREVV